MVIKLDVRKIFFARSTTNADAPSVCVLVANVLVEKILLNLKKTTRRIFIVNLKFYSKED